MSFQKVKDWWSFLRFQNILIIMLTQYLIRIFIIEARLDNLLFNQFDFFILVLTTAIITIGGNTINDIYDFPIDIINKPSKTYIDRLITKKSAWKLYFSTNLFAILSAFYFFFIVHWFAGIFYFLITPILLWAYSYKFKKTILIGNFLVAILCALVPIMVVHAEYPNNQESFRVVQFICGFYALFAFLSTMYREIVKDIEDIEGDKLYESKSLPITFGQRFAKYIALFFGSTIIVLFILVLKFSFFHLILIPIIYSIIRLYQAKGKQDFHHVSQVIKFIMLLGLGLFLVF